MMSCFSPSAGAIDPWVRCELGLPSWAEAPEIGWVDRNWPTEQNELMGHVF